MKIYSYINRKFLRLLGSKNILRINFLFHKFFGEKDLGNIGFDFSKKKTRQFIIQDIIYKKNYKSYLEIGCFDNELFDYVKCNKKVGVDPYNKLTFALDFNKLMVPTPQPDGSERDKSLLSGMFGSFGDAPGGFTEELQEVSVSFGAEYEYKETFAIRAGYFYEHRNKGNRKYFTAGLGFKVDKLQFNFSYLVPQFQEHPLAETLRFGAILDLSQLSDDN